MNQLQKIFNYHNQELRTILVNNEPWFVAKDVADVLNFTDAEAMTRHLDDDEKQNLQLVGFKRGAIIINESGLYSAILRSRKPEAKQFKRWITHEVIPSIRKHGVYATPQTIDQILNDPDFGIKLLTTLKQERDEKAALLIQSQAKDQVIKDLKPKADYTEMILQNKGLVTVNQIAKDYGMSAREMNKLLHNLKVQYKQGNQWLLYRKYDSSGYVHSETIQITRSDGRPDIAMNTKWTQKGRLFIYNLLKGEGILPVIDRVYPVKDSKGAI